MMAVKLGVAGLRVGAAFFDIVAKREDVELAAICDIDKDLLAAKAKEYGIAQAFTHYEDLLGTDVDAVVLATPIQVHGPQAIAALEASKHVLCQYIAAEDEAEAERLLVAAQKSGCAYQFIETDCYERKNLIMQALARKGVFGELTMGRGHYIHDCKAMGRHADGTLTWRGELWMESPGGRVSAVHNAVPLLELFDERVTEVYCYGPGPRTMPEFQKHDRVTTVGKLSSGRIVEMVDDVLSWHPGGSGYCLQGTQGCFEFDRAAVVEDGKISAWKDLATLEKEYALAGLLEDQGGHASAWGACLDAFLSAIASGTPPPQGLLDALHITAIGWAANESLRTGQPARVVQFDASSA
jgi:predicted dehydrogenase